MKAKEIRSFLSTLEDVDRRYLEIQSSMARDARTLIRDFNLAKEDFCKLLKINPDEYQDYISGGFEYDVAKMALMQSAFVFLKMEQVKKEVQEKTTGVNFGTINK